MFREYTRLEFPEIGKSTSWVVWKINKKRVRIGELTEKYRKRADWGLIFSIDMIMDRIKTGSYHGKIIEVQ